MKPKTTAAVNPKASPKPANAAHLWPSPGMTEALAMRRREGLAEGT